MLSYSKRNRYARILIPLFVITALLLAACGGSASANVADGADSSAAAGSSGADDASSEAEMAAEGEVQVEAEADTSAEMDAAEAEADIEVDAAAEADSGAYPELVLGDPTFHETDPSTVQLASGQVQFVEFFAYWCTVCKAIAPTVHGLEDIYGDQVNFVYLDRDNPATAELQSQLGYVYQPHIFILDAEGNVLFESLSYVEGTVLQDAIEQALQ